MKTYPKDIKLTENTVENIEKDIAIFKENYKDDFTYMTLNGETYTTKQEAGIALLDVIKKNPILDDEVNIGNYLGFELMLGFSFLQQNFYLNVKNNHSYKVNLGSDPGGNITRIDNQLNRLNSFLEDSRKNLEDLKQQFEVAKEEMKKPFTQEQELKEAMERLKEVDTALNIDEKVDEILETTDDNVKGQVKEDYER